ncbi:Metal-dependent hydrolase, partial [human gut metagenome]
MDTATHIVMGVGLTALATQDPVMAESFAATATTLIAGCFNAKRNCASY